MVRIILAAAAALVAVATPAAAQQADRPLEFVPLQPATTAATPLPNRITGHSGFFVRPDFGVGFMSASTSSNGGALGISGVTALTSVAVGTTVAENHQLAIHLMNGVAMNPSLSYAGFSGAMGGTQLTMWGIGPEYTYYFMPDNIYVSGTLALTQMSLGMGFLSMQSDWGLGTRLAVGREWCVAEHWGVGVAGHLSLSSNQNAGLSGDSFAMTTWALGLVLSATYN